MPRVTGAPVPGDESGLTWNPDSEPVASTAREIARGVLFVPNAIVWVVLLPVRGVIWVYDRYDLEDRYYATFYNPARTFGIHPEIQYATGFGLMFGGRLISTNTFGDHERFTVAGAYGGTYQASAEAWLDSGNRLGPLLLTIGGNFDRFAHLPFYGIGNEDHQSPPPPLSMPINPLVDDTAVKSYYRYQELRAALNADWRVIDDLHLIGLGAITNIKISEPTTDENIAEIYNPADLVGFPERLTKLYGQLELRWDRRRIKYPMWETTQYTTGYMLDGFVGGVQGLGDAHSFTHYGVDLQAFIHLGLGPRMLWLRFWGEGVTDSLAEVPFYELPYLGGDFLRGYDFARFRNRVSGLLTAQYMWDVQRGVDAFLFVDVGRVYDSLDDVTLSGLRAGFGGGFQLQSSSGWAAAISLASSIDGGLFLTATLTPYWNEVPRWR
jgi:hypothetical protein